MASTADIRNGVVLNMDGGLWTVIDFQHVKPGKGGAFVRTKVKNVMTGKVVDRTFNAGAKIEVETVDRADFQYSYKDGDNYVFMDLGNYDQITLTPTQVGDAANFMLETQNVTIALHNGEPLYVELPASVVLEITYTEPGLQGDRSTGGTKPATVETGYQIQVPLFLEQGTKVKVDTRDGSYLGRVTSRARRPQEAPNDATEPRRRGRRKDRRAVSHGNARSHLPLWREIEMAARTPGLPGGGSLLAHPRRNGRVQGAA